MGGSLQPSLPRTLTVCKAKLEGQLHEVTEQLSALRAETPVRHAAE